MTEPKIIFPAYIRIGECKGCGASVYGPEVNVLDNGLPKMSACGCDRGPNMALAPNANRRKFPFKIKEEAKAA